MRHIIFSSIIAITTLFSVSAQAFSFNEFPKAFGLFVSKNEPLKIAKAEFTVTNASVVYGAPFGNGLNYARRGTATIKGYLVPVKNDGFRTKRYYNNRLIVEIHARIGIQPGYYPNTSFEDVYMKALVETSGGFNGSWRVIQYL